MSDMWELSHRSGLREIKRSRLRLSHMSDMWEQGVCHRSDLGETLER